MFLSVDIGNSDIVFGFFRDRNLEFLFRTATSDEKNAEFYALQLNSFMLENGISIEEVEQVVVSSVVPFATPMITKVSEEMIGRKPHIIGPDTYKFLNVSIRNPVEMGTDLVANCVAAYDLAKSSCLIADFGTALTFSKVGADGTVLGVAIAPGIKTAFESLFLNTAKLPDVPFEIPSETLGNDTVTAIQSGIFFGYEEMARGMIRRIKDENEGELMIFGTGGLVDKLKDLTPVFDKIIPHLTLLGIRIIGEQIENE
jgi:type III pantothenate kinase